MGIVVDRRKNTLETWVLAYSAADGSLRWKAPLGTVKHEPSGNFAWSTPRLQARVADVDGDGVGDLVFWGRDADYKGQGLYAYSGSDGRPLWSPHPSDAMRRHGSPDLPEDGPEVELPCVWQPGRAGKPDLVLASGDAVQFVDPVTRQVRRQWRSPRMVCAAVPAARAVTGGKRQAQEADLELVLLDGQARVRERRFVSRGTWDRPQPPGLRGFPFWVQDLDGDGQDDALWPDGDRPVAASAGLARPLWEWRLPGEPAGAVQVIRPPGGGPATVVVRAGEAVWGLDGRTGRPLWRGAGRGKLTGVLPGAGPNGWTALLFEEAQETECVLALPWGRQPPREAPEGPAEEQRVPRRLPWVGEWERVTYWGGFLF